MKRIFFINSMLVLILAFSACSFWQSDPERVTSISFYMDDGDVPEFLYSESTLYVVPDYEERSLKVSYARSFPFRTAETDEDDVRNEGNVGGTFFDEFEQIVMKYDEGAFVELENHVQCANPSNFAFAVEEIDGNTNKVEFELCQNDTNPEHKMLEGFYRNITNLFSKDIY